MAKVLLVDTNFSSNPIYHFLIQDGHKVTVVGNNPRDALAKSAHDYIPLDYKDISTIKNLIVTHNIEYIIPGCNDASYLTCAQINEAGLFPGIDSLNSTESILNKKKFRLLAEQLNLPIPQMLTESEIGSRWPVIIKPVDAYSGRGISIIRGNDADKLANAQAYACEFSNTQAYVVEDYVEGQLYSHTAFIESGRIAIDYIVEEHSTVNPFTVDTSRVCYDFPYLFLINIRENIQKLVDVLKLKDGLIHTQLICNGVQYWLIEITRRCPGDLYSQLIELSTGFNYVENYTRPFIQKALSFNTQRNDKWIMRHTITQPKECNFGSIEFNVPLNIKKFLPTTITGDRLHPGPLGRIGVLFVEENTEQNLDAIFQMTLQRKLYKIAQ